MSSHSTQTDQMAVAGWTTRRCASPAAVLDLPEISTVVALPALVDHTEGPALDVQCHSFGQGLRHFIARLAHDPL